MLELFTSSKSSVPPANSFSSMYSRMRVEKNRSRDASKRMAERCSISVRISSSSASLSFVVVTGCGFMFGARSGPAGCTGARNHCGLTMRTHGRGRTGFFGRFARATGTELRERFIQLFRELDHVADCRSGLARALRGLARDAGNNLHRVGHTFGAAHLLLRGQGNLLDQFG